jgi:hypothetical protein
MNEYAWGNALEHLATKAQLVEIGMKPHGDNPSPGALSGHGVSALRISSINPCGSQDPPNPGTSGGVGEGTAGIDSRADVYAGQWGGRTQP